MDMIVCVKQILDPETPTSAFKVDDASKKVIPPQGMAPVINPFDSQAVEAALRIRDATGDGKITVLSLGPSSARDAVKHGLDMGIVGPGLGELLGVPVVTITKSVQASDGHLQVERVLMDGFETVEVPT